MADYSAVLTAFLIGALTAFVLVWTRPLHGVFSLDSQKGVQKLHKMPVPRIGGVAVVAGFGAGGLALAAPEQVLWGQVFLAMLPAFVAGLAEDLTKRVSVRSRLIATCLAGLLFSLMTGYRISAVDIPGIDALLGLWLPSLLFTAFAIGGIANAVNIIDGVNGLAAGGAILIFLGFALIAFSVGDLPVLMLCLIASAALAGFLLLNFPMAYLFLGDAGAYSTGFLLAVVAVMLPQRNAELSPLLGLLALSYPVIETLVSVHRRILRAGSHPGQPDRLHLHSLVYRNMSRRLAAVLRLPQLRNPLTGMILWVFPLSSAVLTVLFRESSLLIALGLVLILALYLRLYRRVALLEGRRGLFPLRRERAREA